MLLAVAAGAYIIHTGSREILYTRDPVSVLGAQPYASGLITSCPTFCSISVSQIVNQPEFPTLRNGADVVASYLKTGKDFFMRFNPFPKLSSS